MKNKAILGGLTAFALMLGVGVMPVEAALVGTNGNFASGNVSGNFATLEAGNSTDLTGWTVDSGSVDYIGSYWGASVVDGKSVDLNGLTNGSISQAFPTTVGATYSVTFDLSGNPDSRSDQSDPYYSPSAKVVAVSATGGASVNYSYDTTTAGNSLGDMKWAPQSAYTFVATGTTSTLTFASQIPGAFGPALSNVVINETLPPVVVPPANDCKNGTWKTMNDGTRKFKNQGDCVSYFATKAKNAAAGALLTN